MLDRKSLKVFLTVAELANMTAAGRRLGMSQSAVLQAIRQLEENVGAVLIAHERRPLALTAAGIALRQRGGALVAEAETLFAAAEGDGEEQDARAGCAHACLARRAPAAGALQQRFAHRRADRPLPAHAARRAAQFA